MITLYLMRIKGLLTKWEGADEKVTDDFEKNHSHLVTRAVRLESG